MDDMTPVMRDNAGMMAAAERAFEDEADSFPASAGTTAYEDPWQQKPALRRGGGGSEVRQV